MPLLYKSKVPYADYCINHTVGCPHNCGYCYARDQIAIKFNHVKDEEEWREDYRLKPRVLEQLTEELSLMEKRGTIRDIKDVHLCFSGDPFPFELWREAGVRIRRTSLSIIKLLIDHGLQVTVLTKGILPPPQRLEDLDILGHGVRWGITLVAVDEGFRRKWEPGSAPLAERVRALKELALRAETTWVSMEPFPPPDVWKVDITRLFWEINWVDRIVMGRWNYRKGVAMWAEWYKEKAKDLYELCRQFDKRLEVKDIFTEKLALMLP